MYLNEEEVGGQADSKGPLPCEQWPTISVITPSFNQGQFLEETLLSVLDQQYANIDYMVFDGGSKDQSVQVLQRYDDRLSYWESSPDRGQAHAINKGLERSRGEILAYLNSDDLLLPDTFRTVVNFFTENPEVDLVYGDCRIIDEESRYVETWNSRPFDPVVELCRNFIFQPTVFWRRRLFEQIGMFSEQLRYVMDLDYWYRAIPVGKIAYLNKELACFRRHEESKTSQKGSFFEERSAILEEFFQRNSDLRITQHKSLIYAWHHFHAGEELYGRGDLHSALHQFTQSLKFKPFSLRAWYVLLAVVDNALGTHLLALMQRLHRISP